VKSPKKINKIKKHDIPDVSFSSPNPFLFRILFTVPATWQCVDHKNVVVPEANSELTELVPVFTIQPAFPTSAKKVNTSFKNVCRTWGLALYCDA
jgi:hypothetical protein